MDIPMGRRFIFIINGQEDLAGEKDSRDDDTDVLPRTPSCIGGRTLRGMRGTIGIRSREAVAMSTRRRETDLPQMHDTLLP